MPPGGFLPPAPTRTICHADKPLILAKRISLEHLRNEYLAFIRQKNIFEKRGSRVMRQLINTTAQLAEIIRGRRKVRRISQAELATQLGITQGRFSALEADPSSLPLDRLILLVKLLGLELIIQDKADEPASKAQW